MASVSKAQLREDLRGILKGADLTQLSSKKVRKQLEEKYDEDFTDRKKEIDELLMVLMQEQENGEEIDEDHEGPSAQNNKHSNASHSGDDDSEFDVPKDIGPPKKKMKTPKKKKETKLGSCDNDKISDSDDQEADEEVARRLQNEENGSRRTRSGGAKRPPVKKRAPKKDGTKKKSTYSKPSFLSPALAAIVGSDKLPRSDVVKKLWDIAKERNLFDPKNRQFVICDDELYTVFGRKRVRMFGMMKHLSRHIYDTEESVQ